MLREALQLPPKARADIAGLLLRSLDAGDELGLGETWVAEVTRRVAEVNSGRVKLVPWHRGSRHLRAELRGAGTRRGGRS